MILEKYLNFNDNYIIYTTDSSQDLLDYLLKRLTPRQGQKGINSLLDDTPVALMGDQAIKKDLERFFYVYDSLKETDFIIFSNILSSRLIINIFKVIYSLILKKKVIIIQNQKQEERLWSNKSLLHYIAPKSPTLLKKIKLYFSCYYSFYYFMFKKRILNTLINKKIHIEKIAYGFSAGSLYQIKILPIYNLGIPFFFKPTTGFMKFDKNEPMEK